MSLPINHWSAHLLLNIEHACPHRDRLPHNNLLGDTPHPIVLALSSSIKQKVRRLFKRSQHHGGILHLVHTVSGKANYPALTCHHLGQQTNVPWVDIYTVISHCFSNLVND
jgi:hypothetical protein